jgi:carbon-monoxide dehydrogenase medium subunit
MKTAPFEYHAPRTVDEVLTLLAQHGDEAKVLAGGQSLVPLLAMRLARPSQLVDINEVGELSFIRALEASDREAGIPPSSEPWPERPGGPAAESGKVDGNGVAFGTLTRERDAERSPLVTEHLPVLADALPLIGHVSIRNRGTIGGSMAHADASAELPAVAVITGAEMVVRSSAGERVVPSEEFFVGHFTTSMADDELLTEVRIPTGPVAAGWAFHEIARRHGDFALVGVAAMLSLDGDRIDDARLALIGVADRAVRAPGAEVALRGQPATPDAFAAAAREATKDLEPASDMHGSAEVRRHLATVATRRALTTAASRAGEHS